jgi:molybdopterin/thiamine biosynthesis adenylyltransferase
VGKIVLAHGGVVRVDDLNRQILMTSDWVGRPRVESAARRLAELNPHVEVEAVGENVSAANAGELVGRVDLVVDAAPLFEERLAMNAEVVRQRKVMVDCAMYDWDARLTTVAPGAACLACQHPEPPGEWRRQFPVFGAVAGMIGAMGAAEAIKVITGVGETLAGRMVVCDLRGMAFRVMKVAKDPNCRVCGGGDK